MSQELIVSHGGPPVPAQDMDVAATVTVTQGFGTQAVTKSPETSSAAVAARAQAEVNAKFIVAERRQRDIERFRVRLLKDCQRKGFAERAEYERPVGWERDEQSGRLVRKIARGPSIRLIEAAVRHYGNVDAQAPAIFEGDDFRILRTQMCDLETNTHWSTDVIVPKRVERRGDDKGKPPKGREVISERVNSNGEKTYLVTATDDEVQARQNSLISKAQRNNGRRLLPEDIIEEALEACRQTMQNEYSKDPDGERRKIIDAFAGLRVDPAEIALFVEKPLDRLQPADLERLRKVWAGLRDGDFTWEELMEQVNPAGSRDAQKDVVSQKLASLRKGTPTQPMPQGDAGGNAGSGSAEPGCEGLRDINDSNYEQITRDLEDVISKGASPAASAPPAPPAEKPSRKFKL